MNLICQKILLKTNLALNLLFNHFRPLAIISRIVQRRYGHPPPSITFWQYVFYGYLLLSVLRFVLFGRALKKHNIKFLQWEPNLWHASKIFPAMTGNFLYCMSLLPLYSGYYYYIFDFKVHQIYAVQMVHDLLVVNCEKMLQNNFMLLEKIKFKKSFLESAKRCFEFVRRLWKGFYDRNFKLETASLKHFPGISKRIRIQTALVALFLEMLTGFVMFVAGKFFNYILKIKKQIFKLKKTIFKYKKINLLIFYSFCRHKIRLYVLNCPYHWFCPSGLFIYMVPAHDRARTDAVHHLRLRPHHIIWFFLCRPY